MQLIIKNKFINANSLGYMEGMDSDSVSLTLTDLPYGVVSRASGGLRELDKGNADIIDFDLEDFLNHVYRVTENIIIVFCAKEQFSEVFGFFADKKGTTRPIIWQKSNPSPLNGQYNYLSGVEFAVWFKKPRTKTFQAFCKNTVFKHPNGSSKIHPTEKNHKLLEELILDNSTGSCLVFDPLAGSGSTLLAARRLGRSYFGIELNAEFYERAKYRLDNVVDGKRRG